MELTLTALSKGEPSASRLAIFNDPAETGVPKQLLPLMWVAEHEAVKIPVLLYCQ